jgi:hypothetical protein
MEPFPHIVAHNVLPDDLYATLQAEFPPLETVVAQAPYVSNQRFDYTIKQMRAEHSVSEAWQAFCEANASQSFFDSIISIFGAQIHTLYPDFDTQYGKLASLRTGIRYIDDHDEKDILLDAHIAVNTPVTDKPSSVRVAHVDDPLKLYGGLLYFRPEGDTSEGGDLELYRYVRSDYKFYGQHVDSKYVEVVKTVPYQANSFVFFINSIASLHGVTVRERTEKTRQFFNVVGELPSPLFDIQSKQENIWQKRWRRYKAKITKQGGKW